ncbi:maleylacetate reductase [Sagittula stellata]|uniref:Maleylacetate reductase n=1 Tax=Sagittula stellata (strain ATCC 700073 / DSM 11524 / E-37) TaxID=388399 RepID=A3K7B4_SAGS3|nr:maleylacetate reductase [Sagittula stellata]EBA06873.1 maleylacetate reductase [Sagittula stellata E-37]
MIGTLPRDSFRFNPLPTRVLFGAGTRSALAEEVAAAGITRALVLTTPGQKGMGEEIAQGLGDLAVGVFGGAAMHTPTDVTQVALDALTAAGVDGVVSVGGGSTIGLGKALAARTGVAQVVLPTTYAGSEMTPILGETEDGLKTTRSGPEIQPEVVIYDIELTHSLPAGMSVTSGINAIAHAVEALYAPNGNPVMDALALEGIRALVGALPRIAADPAGGAGREAALYGAWLCGTCLGNVGMALHHKLCHTLGGSFGLPHAETHTVILPHALAYNAPAVPEVMAALRPILGDDPAAGLHALARDLGAPVSLRALDLPEDAIDRATELSMQARYPNPRPLEAEAIRATLARAWAGDAPISEGKT